MSISMQFFAQILMTRSPRIVQGLQKLTSTVNMTSMSYVCSRLPTYSGARLLLLSYELRVHSTSVSLFVNVIIWLALSWSKDAGSPYMVSERRPFEVRWAWVVAESRVMFEVGRVVSSSGESSRNLKGFLSVITRLKP